MVNLVTLNGPSHPKSPYEQHPQGNIYKTVVLIMTVIIRRLKNKTRKYLAFLLSQKIKC